MKQFILSIFFLVSSIGFSQSINENLKQSIETDNTEELQKELKNQNYTLNECFQLKEKPYSLFALAIKLESYLIVGQGTHGKNGVMRHRMPCDGNI